MDRGIARNKGLRGLPIQGFKDKQDNLEIYTGSESVEIGQIRACVERLEARVRGYGSVGRPE